MADTDLGKFKTSRVQPEAVFSLAVAVKGHQSEVCKVLIEADANPNLEDGSGKKPYDRALHLHSKLSDRVTMLSGVGDGIGGNDTYFGSEPEYKWMLKRFFYVGRKDLAQPKEIPEEAQDSSDESQFKGCVARCGCCRTDEDLEEEEDYIPITKKPTFRRSSVVALNNAPLSDLIVSPGLGYAAHSGSESKSQSLNKNSLGLELSGGSKTQTPNHQSHLAKRQDRNTPGLAGAISILETPTNQHGVRRTFSKNNSMKRNKINRRASFLSAIGVGVDRPNRLVSGMDFMLSLEARLYLQPNMFARSPSQCRFRTRKEPFSSRSHVVIRVKALFEERYFFPSHYCSILPVYTCKF